MDLANTLLIFGGLLLAFGVLLWLAVRAGLPLGRLPGDLSWRGRRTAVFLPLGTSLLLSVLLSLLISIVTRLRH